MVVGGNRISCFQCGALFHGEPSCVGVSEEVIDCICGDALRYICITCRSSETATVDSQVGLSGVFGQLLTAVVALTRRGSELAEKLNVLTGGNVNVGKNETTVLVCTNSNFSNQRLSGLEDREIVRQEFRELEEQRRRSECTVHCFERMWHK